MTYPEPINLSPLFRGDSRNEHFEIDDGTNPIDLTGSKVSFCMKKDKNQTVNDGTNYVLIEVTNHTHADAGITDITITSQDTKDLIPGNYQYDVQLTTVALQNFTFQFGSIQIMADVNNG